VDALRELRPTHPADRPDVAAQEEKLMHPWWQDLIGAVLAAVLGWFARHFSIPPENR